jgi:hypothetical protein
MNPCLIIRKTWPGRPPPGLVCKFNLVTLRTSTRIGRAAVCVATTAAAGVAACDHHVPTGPDGIPESQFAVTVSGGAHAQLGGLAVLYTDSTNTDTTRVATPLGPGASAANATPIAAASGTLTFIATHGHGDPRGRFTFTGTITPRGAHAPVTITVRGVFDAILGDVVAVWD